MATIKPFCCVRPKAELASRIAALPYDVYNREEAKKEVQREAFSFLKIDRAETGFDDSVDTYDDAVYKKASEQLEEWIQNGTFLVDSEPAYYVYELTMNDRIQTGLVACASIDDYCNNVIKKHENTREDKEQDRIRHVDSCNAQTGPIFLAYRAMQEIDYLINEVKKESALYDFVALDGVTHRIWKIFDKEKVQSIADSFEKLDRIYIADGHHRAASAIKVGCKRREKQGTYSGEEEFNTFLSVLFPHNQLLIMDYNRTIKDCNGLSVEELLEKVSDKFNVIKKDSPVAPCKKGTFGMFIDNNWYELTAKKELFEGKDAVQILDVAILQDNLLGPILGIGDPRTDKRIDFVGGIRGLEELERRANKDMRLSFSLYPTSIKELFDVADNNQLMPPKSTWFEPKLRSGLFIHQI